MDAADRRHAVASEGVHFREGDEGGDDEGREDEEVGKDVDVRHSARISMSLTLRPDKVAVTLLFLA